MVVLRVKRNRKQEGAAMLVVMLLLLIVTATATFAVRTTSLEIRSSGYARQHMQTRYLTEGALAAGLAMGENRGAALQRQMIHQSTSGALAGAVTPIRRLATTEPVMDSNVGNDRIEVSHFAASSAVVGQPIVTTAGAESYGLQMGYAPTFVVDVNDEHAFYGVVPGQRSDGNGTFEYMAATYTARGAARVAGDRASPRAPADDVGSTQDDWSRLGYHETTATSRAITIAGPVPRAGGR